MADKHKVCWRFLFKNYPQQDAEWGFKKLKKRTGLNRNFLGSKQGLFFGAIFKNKTPPTPTGGWFGLC
jgi:hypothetical protein